MFLENRLGRDGKGRGKGEGGLEERFASLGSRNGLAAVSSLSPRLVVSCCLSDLFLEAGLGLDCCLGNKFNYGQGQYKYYHTTRSLSLYK